MADQGLVVGEHIVTILLILIVLLPALLFLASEIYMAGEKDGQIDAANGAWHYKLKLNKDGTKEWTKMDISTTQPVRE